MASTSMVLAHDVHGAAHPKAVVLLHSLALDRSVWRRIIEPLAKQRAVIAVDLRGHGASPKSAAFSIEDMADDVATTLAALDRRSATVVGMSMGGCVAQAFAVRHPDQVDGLGLIDTTAWYGAEAPRAWQERATKARQSGLRSLSQFQLTRWFGDDFRAANESLCQELLDVFAANDLDSYAAACTALGAFDARERITSIATPTVIVVGEDDGATPPSHAAEIQRRISGAVMHVVPKTRHLTALERPEEVLEHLHGILA